MLEERENTARPARARSSHKGSVSRFRDVVSLPFDTSYDNPKARKSPTDAPTFTAGKDSAATISSLALVSAFTVNESRAGEQWAVTCVTVPFWLQKGGA